MRATLAQGRGWVCCVSPRSGLAVSLGIWVGGSSGSESAVCLAGPGWLYPLGSGSVASPGPGLLCVQVRSFLTQILRTQLVSVKSSRKLSSATLGLSAPLCCHKAMAGPHLLGLRCSKLNSMAHN